MNSSQTVSRARGDDLIRKLISGGGWAFLAKLTTYPLGLILTMVLARLLSETEMGGYFLCMSMIMLTSGLVQGGLGATMCKKIASARATNQPVAIKKTIRVGVAALLIIGTIAFLILNSAPGIWILSQLEGGEQLHATITWIACLVVFFAAIGYACEILRGFNELGSASLLAEQLLQRFLLLGALLISFLIGYDLLLVDVLRIATFTAFLTVLIGIGLIIPKVVPLGHHGASIRTLELFREAPTFLLMRVNFWLLNSAAIWVLGFSNPLGETALYGAANALTLLVLAPWHVVNHAVAPTIVTLNANGERDRLEAVVRAVAAVAVLPASIIALGLTIFGREALSLLFSAPYRSAYFILVLLALGRCLSTFFGPPMILLSMTNYQTIVLRILLITAVLTFLGYWVVAPQYGAIGVAAISAGSATLQNLFLAIVAHKRIGVLTFPQLSFSAWKIFIEQIKFYRRPDTTRQN